MKKILYTIGILILLIVTSVHFANATIVTVDSYSESNVDFGITIRGTGGGSPDIGQTFTSSISGKITEVKFYGRRTGSPTGNATAKLYNITGTYGTDSIQSGTALATSDNLDVSTISTSDGLITLTFSGANQFTMTNGNKYAIQFNFTGGGASDYLVIGYDQSSPTHSGNFFRSNVGFSSADTAFYVYGDNGAGGSPVVSGSGQKMMMGMGY